MFKLSRFSIANQAVTLLFLIMIWACKPVNDTANLAVVEGTVYTYQNGELKPLQDALVTAVEVYQQTATDVNGAFSFSLDLESEQEITIKATKAGYADAEVSAIAKPGETFKAPEMTMAAVQSSDTSGTQPTADSSGVAAHIILTGDVTDHIYIYSSGLPETSTLNFVVTDAEGNPVDDNHKVTVFFRIVNGPGGGEYVFPDSMTTQNSLVRTTVSSGIKAGPVQLEAYFIRDNQVFRTIPVRITIYGGLPDADHFSIAADRYNIAGQAHFGLTDDITAFVGDQYGNPVAPGTVVYFTTEYGIMQGAALTDELGRATATYLTAAPLPPDPLNNSFTTITARTYGDTLGEKILTAEASVLLSAATADIEISPSTFEYTDINTSVGFDFSVKDIYGNPLVADTRVNVTGTAGELFGNTDFTLKDAVTPGNGTTDFVFSWASGDSLNDEQVYITITVTSPEGGNGSRSLQIVGTKKTGN